ncbi:YqaE/Pmp3 family membrane protein [Mycoplasma bradburyae]|uniref:Cardiolipin synthase N-terminal domain-containing protein n=1 Tax=Mycoplasma bradburyae TaxID=2963128 RepID=A0AAW6HS25_9MOLU|nr:YqaE/Pmp3 family membrane protein [Mycoplasma bradburyae]MDC4163613.1 hypothetical protein [Mycoplasma bradburyae]MDC4182210.1 hypothetical protein [Mycoplasma bradburyae]MDC4182979.1 hypothetical protein [Mycoplasma bradburyae]MDC4183716.1 hypothetical protein [Mycoplasma bradburyae]MDC4184396.1 hypothetical protein [Mycoplasma bradburyae]
MARRDKGIDLIIFIILLILGIVPGVLYAIFKLAQPKFNWIAFVVLCIFFIFPGVIYLLTCSDLIIFNKKELSKKG